MRIPVFALALAFAASTSSPAAVPDAMELVRLTASHYVALVGNSYDFDVTEVHDSASRHTEMHHHVVGAGGRYREEMRESGTLYVFDGYKDWVYHPPTHEYRVTPSPVRARIAATLSHFELISFRSTSARLLRTEPLRLAAGPVACQVIEVEYEPSDAKVRYSPLTLWIDPARQLVMKMVRRVTTDGSDPAGKNATTESYTFTRAEVGGPVSADLLSFTPPEGAVRVDKIDFAAPAK
jgi:hypothetical protein